MNNDELIQQLNELADWIEKHQSVHTFSVPRRAAFCIDRLQKENDMFRIQLNKKDVTLKEHIDRIIGKVYFTFYVAKKNYKEWKKKKT